MLLVFALAGESQLHAQAKPREHDLKLPIGGTPGRLNAIGMIRNREAKLAYAMEGRSLIAIVSIMWRDEEGG